MQSQVYVLPSQAPLPQVSCKSDNVFSETVDPLRRGPRCGLVVCAHCSSHADVLDPAEVVHEPGMSHRMHDEFLSHIMRYRTCDTCHSAIHLSLDTRSTSPTSVLSATAALFSTSSLASSGGSESDAGASDTSELTDCPVCGTSLSSVGDKDAQEAHVKDCLETGGGAVAQGGRYLTFKLPPGPLGECL